MTPPLARCVLAAAFAAVTGPADARAQQAAPSSSRSFTPSRFFAAAEQRARPAAVGTEEASLQPRTVRAAPSSDAAADDDEPLRLPPPGARRPSEARGPAPSSVAGSFTRMIGGLAIVLGLFFFAAWFTRRSQPQAAAVLPVEVVQVLGRAPLSGRQHMHLVRFGGKLLLVSVTPTGAETLSEITDPMEVDRLAGVCQQNQPGSITKTFRQVLHQLGGEPVSAGFVGRPPQSPAELARDAREGSPSAVLSRGRTQS